MGNRAVITTKNNHESNGVGIYLHWNGGRDSVEAFIKYMELRMFRPVSDCYGWARLCQIIGNFFGGGLSIGIDKVWKLDTNNGDNGVYIIAEDKWEIVDRKCFKGTEQNTYPLVDMLLAIDSAQPINEQLGEEFIKAEEIPTSMLVVGDIVFIPDYTGKYEKYEVVGIGSGKTPGGMNINEIPYIAKYGDIPAENINNYLLEDKYRVHRLTT